MFSMSLTFSHGRADVVRVSRSKFLWAIMKTHSVSGISYTLPDVSSWFRQHVTINLIHDFPFVLCPTSICIHGTDFNPGLHLDLIQLKYLRCHYLFPCLLYWILGLNGDLARWNDHGREKHAVHYFLLNIRAVDFSFHMFIIMIRIMFSFRTFHYRKGHVQSGQPSLSSKHRLDTKTFYCPYIPPSAHHHPISIDIFPFFHEHRTHIRKITFWTSLEGFCKELRGRLCSSLD